MGFLDQFMKCLEKEFSSSIPAMIVGAFISILGLAVSIVSLLSRTNSLREVRVNDWKRSLKATIPILAAILVALMLNGIDVGLLFAFIILGLALIDAGIKMTKN